ncbi:unnamed protein product [Ostreobium quekettii]|uniref:RRM domain-containing protein n=1 Tax=Ostreobium quekettii TaxID=121088 RepID=A0A8S1IRL8_9CHLO|nr:unnamed protein product [Ostreobium quekettii]
MENLNGAVLNHGRGPKVKVLLAESPNVRSSPHTQRQVDLELAFDPDNVPPRSRLFLVVPKTADAQAIKEDMGKCVDLEYCKTDLIASKGVVFCKFQKASAALKAMEDICETGTLCGYKVKCMLAEPKSKHPRLEGLMHASFGPSVQTQLDFTMGGLHLSGPHTARSAVRGDFKIPASPSAISCYGGYPQYADTSQAAMTQMGGYPDYGGLSTMMQGVSGLANLGGALNGMSVGNLATMQALNGKMDAVSMAPQGGAPGLGHLGAMRMSATGAMESMPVMSMGSVPPMGMAPHDYTAISSGLSPGGSPPILSKQRLFVVVYKGVKEEELSRLFRRYSGMEYCDLKKDKKTSKSKGYCYVNYSTHEAAKAAIQALNGIEFPPHSGHRMKVMFAEPLGVRSAPSSPGMCAPSGGGPPGGPIPAYDKRLRSVGQGNAACGCAADLTAAPYDESEGSVGSDGAPLFENEPEDDKKVFTMLSRQLPDYAIRHVFSKCGAVEGVRLHKDRRFGVVTFASSEFAKSAVQMLNGTDILGEGLTVSASPIVPSPSPECPATGTG